MKIPYLFYTILVTLASGCYQKENLGYMASNPQEKVYLIKKGSHAAAGNHFKILHTDVLRCQVIFDSSAVYQSLTAENQEDVNKLIGFSDCNDNHQQNSARLGWSWNGHAVALSAYAYVNGERVIKPLAAFPLNQWITCSVSARADQYFFSVGNVTDSVSRHCTGYTGSRYRLYPYFGGDELAPHDIMIKVKEN